MSTIFLKQSTACTIMFGPFVDKTDGVTLKTDSTTITDIDHATTGIFLSKNGGTAAIRHQNVTASVADAYGMMKVTLDTTDTGTLGSLDVLFAKAATYLPVYRRFEVVAANIYDSLIGGTDLFDVSATQFAGQTITAAAGVTLPTSVASPTNITAASGVSLAADQAVNVTKWNGTAVSAPSTAGIPEVNVKNIANAAVSTSTAQLGVNLVNIAGSAVSTSTAQLGVNAVQAGATAWGSGAITAGSIATGAITNAKFAAGAIDAAAIADSAIDNATFAADVGSTAYATNKIALAADKSVVNAALATAAELAKVPKSDSTVSWNATALAAINTAAVGTALTESYAADGATATAAQLLYMIWARLAEPNVSSTTMTVKKLDGSTSAMTFTLSDASNPTSLTRAS